MTTSLWVTIALAAFQGLLVPLAAGILREVRRQLDDHKQELKELRTRHEDLLGRLPRDFVLREDFTRVMVDIDRKLERLVEKMTEMAKGLYQHLGKDGTE